MNLGRIWPSLILVLVLLLFFTQTAYADGPQILTNEAEFEFPTSITFKLSASADTTITSVELIYGNDEVGCALAAAYTEPEDFEPGTNIETSWVWDLEQYGSLPSGTRVWWQWHLIDELGAEIISEEQELFFLDTNFEWQEVRSDELIFFSAVTDQTVNDALWEAANAGLDQLEEDLGARPERPVTIYNYPTTADMRDAVILTQDWAGGLAMINYDTVLLGANAGNLDWGTRTMIHELAHVIIHQATDNCVGDIPRWLDEGLASYVEGQIEEHSAALLEDAIANDALISLLSLSSSFPTRSQSASLAYAQSGELVGYLIDTYGQDKLIELLDVFQAGRTYDQALLEVYGIDTLTLDNNWRESLGLPPHEPVPTATPVQLPTLLAYEASPTAEIVETPASSTIVPTEIPPTPTVTPTSMPNNTSLQNPPPPTTIIDPNLILMVLIFTAVLFAIGFLIMIFIARRF